MVKEFCLAWEKNKGKLEEYLRSHEQSEYCDYEYLVKLLFDIVINPEILRVNNQFDSENILVIDDGDYQGTQIFVLHRNTHQPSVDEYVYTNTYYGSCSGCDTLQAIHFYDYGLPTEEQVKDYMKLCLDLLQKCVFMINPEDVNVSRNVDMSIQPGTLANGTNVVNVKVGNDIFSFTVEAAKQLGMNVITVANNIEH